MKLCKAQAHDLKSHRFIMIVRYILRFIYLLWIKVVLHPRLATFIRRVRRRVVMTPSDLRQLMRPQNGAHHIFDIESMTAEASEWIEVKKKCFKYLNFFLREFKWRILQLSHPESPRVLQHNLLLNMSKMSFIW